MNALHGDTVQLVLQKISEVHHVADLRYLAGLGLLLVWIGGRIKS